MQQYSAPTRAVTPSEPRGEGLGAGRPRGPLVRLVAAAAIVLGLIAVPTAAFAEETPLAEPVQPLPVLVYGDCAATLSVVELVPGRAYDIVVTDASGAVEYASGAWTAAERVLDSFASVGPGAHTLVVTDIAAPTFQAVRTLSVAACAETAPAEPIVVAGPESIAVAPTIALQPATCDLLGTTDLRATFSGLGSGTYTTGVTSGGSPVPGVADARVTSSANSAVFADLTNGGRYSVWIKDSTGAVVATAGLTMPVCDLPTLSDPSAGVVDGGVQERELAETGSGGAPLTVIALAAAAALQGGALIGGIALLRRRGSARHTA